MGQALYRRYRSKNLAEIVGQEHITRTLDNTLKRGAIGHAYLLTGPKGVGKTSIARILAHEINELPYEKEQIHLDIIEIDAASNRRIDEIRDLRDKVHIAPSSAKYKVYIIDEVHMLTKEAFNALLKTLEEPPNHVIFILATTDVHKVPDTIISRTQHFTFKPIPSAKIVKHLQEIAKKEKISIADDALQFIAEHGDGSFRDSIGLLEQASGISDKVTASQVQQMLGIPPIELIAEIIAVFEAGDAKKLIENLNELSLQGFLAEEIAHQLQLLFRDKLIQRESTVVSIPSLIRDLIDVPASNNPMALLEITLLGHMKIIGNTTTKLPNKSEDKTPDKKVERPAPRSTEQPKKSEQIQEYKVEPTNEVVKKQPTLRPQASSVMLNDESWEAVLAKLKKSHSTLYSVARMSEFKTDGTKVTLLFKFPFHKKRMENSKHKTILDDLFLAITEQSPVIKFELIEKNASPKIVTKPAKVDEYQPLEAISNIFGGGEVLES